MRPRLPLPKLFSGYVYLRKASKTLVKSALEYTERPTKETGIPSRSSVPPLAAAASVWRPVLRSERFKHHPSGLAYASPFGRGEPGIMGSGD